MNEEELKNKFLPIGTVCLLKGASRYVMITGFLPVSLDRKKRMFDYNGCPYPYGIMSTDRNMVFNHEQIKEVIFMGYVNADANEFLQTLPDAKKDLEENGGVNNE
jgi:hypothetical protein